MTPHTNTPHYSLAMLLQRSDLRARLALLLAFAAVAVLLDYRPLANLIGRRSDYYSHIILIPFVTIYFLAVNRSWVSRIERHDWRPGIGLAFAGLLLYLIAWWQARWLGDNDFGALATFGSLVFVWGGFLLLFGRKAFRAALFPLFFLAFAIPVPQLLLDSLIYVLQVSSTEVVQWLFNLTGTTYFREGFVYQLVGINIEVAKECSGIRSTLGLIISSVLAGYLFLQSGWRRIVLLVAILPLTIFKNAVRIVTLSLLAVHVDTTFITHGALHHSGGIVFYLPSLAILFVFLWWLRKGEEKGDGESGSKNTKWKNLLGRPAGPTG
jgi:exosortase